MGQGQYSLDDAQAVPTQKGQFSFDDVEEQQAPHEGFLGAFGSDIWNMAKSVPQMLNPIPSMPPSFSEAEKMGEQARAKYQERRAAGYSAPYSVLAPAAEQMGINVGGMEQAAKAGDPNAVLGHAAAPAAVMVGIPAALKGANAVLPSTTRAGVGLGTLNSLYEDHPAPATRSLPIAQEIAAKLERTRERGMPGPVQAFMDRADGTTQRSMGIAPSEITFPELREFRTVVNRMVYDRDLGPLRPDLKRLAKAMHEDTLDSAKAGGFAKEYIKWDKEYRAGKSMVRRAEDIGPYLGALGGYEAGRLVGAPMGAEFVLGYAGKHIGKPVVGSMVRSVVERGGGRTPSLIPPISPVRASPEEYTRQLLRAKEGETSPGNADRIINKLGGSTKVRRLFQPESPPED